MQTLSPSNIITRRTLQRQQRKRQRALSTKIRPSSSVSFSKWLETGGVPPIRKWLTNDWWHLDGIECSCACKKWLNGQFLRNLGRLVPTDAKWSEENRESNLYNNKNRVKTTWKDLRALTSVMNSHNSRGPMMKQAMDSCQKDGPKVQKEADSQKRMCFTWGS